MSFGEFVFSTGFIQKIIKVDLDVRFNCVYLQRNRHQKTLEDSRGLHTEVEGKTPPGGADWPYLQVGRPMGPPISLRVAILVPHRLLGCIYVIL
jgi:hypothetical protein